MQFNNINQVNLVGQISNEPRFSEKNGEIQATFSLRTNDAHLNASGQTSRKSNWHNVVVHGRLVRVIQELGHKSQALHLSGRLVSRYYRNKQGITQTIQAVEAEDLSIL